MSNLLVVIFSSSSFWSLEENTKRHFLKSPPKKGTVSVIEFSVMHLYGMSFSRKGEPHGGCVRSTGGLCGVDLKPASSAQIL